VAQQTANKIAAAIAIGNAKQLISLHQESGVPWEISATLGCKAAEGLIKLGYDDEALGILKELEARFPRAVRPKQLCALALARRAVKRKSTDDLDEAQTIMAELYAAGQRDPETLGIYGRTWMDRYQLDQDLASLRKSRDLYAEAFDAAQDDYYTGINAAT